MLWKHNIVSDNGFNVFIWGSEWMKKKQIMKMQLNNCVAGVIVSQEEREERELCSVTIINILTAFLSKYL